MYPYIDLLGKQVQSYHVCAILAALAGILLSSLYLKKEITGARAVFLPLFTAVFALAGARLLNFITYPRAFSGSFSVWTLSYRQLSLMGGLISGLIAVLIFSVLTKTDFAVLADAFTIPAAAGIIILKLGCFLNGCCHGKPTNGPFGMIFPANAPKYDFIIGLKSVSAKSPVVHPTQLYEIAGALIALTAAVLLAKRLKLNAGSRAATFALLFAAARWSILPLRELPYDRQIISVFYPCLYAGIIISAAVFLVLRFEQKAS